MSRIRPTADFLPWSERRRIQETLDVLSDPDLMAQVQTSRAYFDSGQRGFSVEEVFGKPLGRRQNAG